MSGFDGIKGHRNFAGNQSDAPNRFEPVPKGEQPAARRTTGRIVAGGMLALGATACAQAKSPFIADGNPQQGGGAVYEPVIQDGTPMPFTPEPPFVADGNPLQGGGSVYEPITPVEPPFIADGNPIRGGGQTHVQPAPGDEASRRADSGRGGFWKMFRRS